MGIQNIKMALSSSLATRCNLLSVSKGFRWIHSTSSVGALSKNEPLAQSDAGYLKEGFWDKNKRLARPLSPHLTIYKPQMTSMLSITHRGTGVAWSLVLSGVGIGAIFSPVTFPTGLAALQSLQIGAPLIFIVKYGLSWMVCYHTINGLRHLAWDLGYGFTMPELYKTGYTVVVLSTILALSMACL